MQLRIMNNNENKEINKIKIGLGIRKVSLAILLMFIGPVILNSAFKNEAHFMYYPVIVIGICVCGTAMYQFFKGIKTIVKGIFND